MPLDVYDPAAPKKATNVSINSDLLRQARELGVNLSQELERRLAELVRQRKREQLIEELRPAMEAYADFLREHGSFADEHRTF